MEKKTKFTEKVKKFDLTPFPYTLTIVVSDDPQQSRSNRDGIYGTYYHSENVSAMHSAGNGFSHVFIKYGADIGDITHEICHFTWSLMRYIGAEHNNEVMAYYTGHYLREAAKFCYEVTQASGIKLPTTTKRISPAGPKKKVVKKAKKA